jgi:hypothetical protein
MGHHHFTDKHRGRSFGLRALRMIGLVVGGVVLAAAFALVLAIIVQWLWNWLMPDIFSLKEITFWQAFGLLFLARLLFGTLGGRHGNSHGGRKFRDVSERWHHSACHRGDEQDVGEEVSEPAAGR